MSDAERKRLKGEAVRLEELPEWYQLMAAMEATPRITDPALAAWFDRMWKQRVRP